MQQGPLSESFWWHTLLATNLPHLHSKSRWEPLLCLHGNDSEEIVDLLRFVGGGDDFAQLIPLYRNPRLLHLPEQHEPHHDANQLVFLLYRKEVSSQKLEPMPAIKH